jgi:uncharacterized membrane protein
MLLPARSKWLIPILLILLSFIPILAGSIRLIDLSKDSQINADNTRFFTAPLPIVLHIISFTIYCILGAFQFASSFRSHKPNWHRAAGWILIPCGLCTAITGLWMTQFYPTKHYPPVNFDGSVLYAMRLLVGFAMALFIVLGLAAILRRDIPNHRVWMMRSYALGLGAGTQVFTHIPMFLFTSIQGELARTICMGAGWAINFAVAEWLISSKRYRRLS